ncbi:Sua5/YciO/YrdC/YwlC family protein [Candidatus Kaiserbacteria bacterium]|nr:Sua5/YciO/YrdC/YwlC family protein [Candidatus Kaiserbacteria bacterium]
MCGSARIPKAVEAIYSAKNRKRDKPVIALIASIEDIRKFNIAIEKEMRKKLLEFWSSERPTSVAIPAPAPALQYLHRGTGQIAFRIPANPEGMKPAETIIEAIEYFGNSVNFYVDGGTLKGNPSRLIRIGKNGKIEEIRK